MGDFNNVLSSADRIGGNLVSYAECTMFRTMVMDTQLQEVRSIRWALTWWNNQQVNLIYSRIDRCFGNELWHDKYGHLIVENMN